MKNKFLFYMILLVFIVLSISFSTSNLSYPSMCCEKNKNGVWCINELEDDCDSSYRMAPSSCSSTSYCRLGTCYDSSEGICYENTPQRVCEESKGTWDPRPLKEVPQCQLGCCIIADQAAFVPLVRCKKLSTYFGVQSDYRTDVGSEMECIILANSQDMGACVYEKEFQMVCDFTTRKECGADESIGSLSSQYQTSSQRTFHKDYLCSAEELNTICARQTTTGCYQGKVYWFDSCGNRENVFSSDRTLSWNKGKVLDPDLICSPNDGNDPNCGNCEYLLGSRCEARHGLLSGSQAYCQKTECTYKDSNGESHSYKNGESWCINDGFSGDGLDKVGSRYYRMVCIDGEIRVEPCADYRNEVCYQSKMPTSKDDYSVSACRVNRWQACIGITDANQCLNQDKRDCMWLPSPTGLIIGNINNEETSSSNIGSSSQSSQFTNPTSSQSIGSAAPITGAIIFSEPQKQDNETTITNREYGVCVPRYSPGLQFWDESSENVCSLISARCVVEYKRGAFSKEWECTDNCHCLESQWAIDLNRICTSQGDCGAYINYIGKFTDSGYEWLSASGKKAFKTGDESYIKTGFGTGKVVLNDFGEEMEGSLNKEMLK
jgi:hypothetical protein